MPAPSALDSRICQRQAWDRGRRCSLQRRSFWVHEPGRHACPGARL